MTRIPEGVTSAEQFSDLIEKLSCKGQVVILIDEYDKMVSDHINSPHVEDLRRVLGNFYQVIKGSEALIRFAFLTGVTRLTMAGIFGGLNNLNDISMDEDYATMFGYTQEELEENFADYIELGMQNTGLDRQAYLEKMREMYDGYRFEEDAPKVYNPVSVGLFFSKGGAEFNNYWFETGGNTKLVMNVAKEVDFNIAVDPEKPVSALSLTRFDIAALKDPSVDSDDLKWLLYQTGYLTIKSYNPLLKTYTLEFPNQEVAGSFSAQLLGSYAPRMPDTMLSDLVGSLMEGRLEKFFTLLEGVYASIDYPSKYPGEYDFAIVLKTLAYVYDPVVAMGGAHQPRACGHGGEAGGCDLPVRVQGGQECRGGAKADRGEAVLAEVRCRRKADPSGGGLLLQGKAQHRGLEGEDHLRKILMDLFNFIFPFSYLELYCGLFGVQLFLFVHDLGIV